MSFHFNIKVLLARALSDLRIGFPVALQKDASIIAVLPIENASSDRIEEFLNSSESELVLTKRRANKLKARVYDKSIARIALPNQVKVSWVRALGDPSLDLQIPLKGPLTTKRGGDDTLQELSLELTRKARLLPAVLAKPTTQEVVQSAHLSLLNCNAFNESWQDPAHLTMVSKANIPLHESIQSTIYLFRETYAGEEHCAVVFGNPSPSQPVLIRHHSACFTGDVLGSLKCDCRQQLNLGISEIMKEGHGVLLYVNQEGRGIGLINKIRAYSLQDQGFDTVEANHRLGFEDDERDFRLGSEILHLLGFHTVRILTNNPLKVKILEEEGIKVVQRLPVIVKANKFNAEYLAIKAKKSGHLL